MQAGIVYGYIGQTEYIINRMKAESGLSNIKVVATGGLGNIIVKETNVIDIYDSKLTLHGLRLIWEKNQGTAGGER
jgi:type III pantothenate kinase